MVTANLRRIAQATASPPLVPDEPYHGPDPEADEKGDGSDEDQGT